MVSIRRVLAQVKDDWTAVLSEEHLTRICREAGATWRCRTLTPVVTIHVFLLQVLHGNTAMTHLPRLSGKRFTPAAYCQARKRLPLVALRRLLQETGAPLRAGTGGAPRWRGHRTWLSDGSSCSLRTRRPCRDVSASRADRRKAAASRSLIGSYCSTPGAAGC